MNQGVSVHALRALQHAPKNYNSCEIGIAEAEKLLKEAVEEGSALHTVWHAHLIACMGC